MISHKKFDNGFKYIEIQNSHAQAKIALQGAHLFHYKARNKPSLLWLSEASYFEEGKAIRGGIPVCFPWFGKNKDNPTLPQHGFGRTEIWKISLEEEQSDGSTHVRLQLKPNTHTLNLWDYVFDAHIDIIVGKELAIALEIRNTDNKPFEISTALHTYFSVSDIGTVYIEGLKNRVYINHLDGKNYTQKDDVRIQEEVDRVYLNPSKTLILKDSNSKVNIQQEGSNSTVVWNPWKEKSKQMADMNDEGYKTMVCIETCNAIDDARVLHPNESHVLKAVISQEREK